MIICFTKCSKLGIAYLIDQYFDSTTDVDSLEGVDDYRITPAELKQICKQTLDAKGVIDQLRQLSELARQNEEEAKKAEEEEELEKQRRISLLKKMVAEAKKAEEAEELERQKQKKQTKEDQSDPAVDVGETSENLVGGADATTPAVDDDDSKTDVALNFGGELAKDENVKKVGDDNDGVKENHEEEEVAAKVDSGSMKPIVPPKMQRVVSHPSGHVVGEIITPAKLMPRSTI